MGRLGAECAQVFTERLDLNFERTPVFHLGMKCTLVAPEPEDLFLRQSIRTRRYFCRDLIDFGGLISHHMASNDYATIFDLKYSLINSLGMVTPSRKVPLGNAETTVCQGVPAWCVIVDNCPPVYDLYNDQILAITLF